TFAQDAIILSRAPTDHNFVFDRSKCGTPDDGYKVSLAKSVIQVYNTNYSDCLLAGSVRYLEDFITQHQRNLRTLADANDALTRRLEEVEAKVKRIETGGEK